MVSSRFIARLGAGLSLVVLCGGTAISRAQSSAPAPRLLPAVILNATKVSKDDDPHLSDELKVALPCDDYTLMYRLCVAPDGSVSSAQPLHQDLVELANIKQTLQSWRFAPRDRETCAIQSFTFRFAPNPTYCATWKDAAPYLDPLIAKGLQRNSTNDPTWPKSDAQRAPAVAAGEPQSAVYSLCVDKGGVVSRAAAVRGIPDADATILSALRRIEYLLPGIPFCTFYMLHSAPAAGAQASGQQPAKERTAAPKWIPANLIRNQALSLPSPHLPERVKSSRRGQVVTASYKVCIATEGTISTVEPMRRSHEFDWEVLSTMYTWRYKPQPAPLCFVQFFEWHIE